MKLTKSLISVKSPINTYEIHFWYSHGDGDSTSEKVFFVKDKSEEQIVEYLTRFKEMAEDIHNHNEHGMDLPDYFKKLPINIHGMALEPFSDVYAQKSSCEYYASMGIEKIFYYNSEGSKFAVSGF